MEKDNYNELEESSELRDKLHIMYLKSLLIMASELDLVDMYKDADDYGWFIDTLSIALEEEPAFFLLDERFLQMASEILESKRFEYRTLPNYNDVANTAVGLINELRALSPYQKNLKVQNYIAWNLDTRNLPANLSMQDLYRTLGYDAIVIDACMDGEVPEITTPFFIASTNYIASIAPEFYDASPLARETTLTHLEEESKKRGFWNYKKREAAKKTVKEIQKIKVKEE